jgi:hypothetical protein
MELVAGPVSNLGCRQLFPPHALTVAAMMAITDLDRFKAAWRFI